jgi:ribokinase
VTAALTVVGSINVDLTLRVERFPRPGETVGGTDLYRAPGGKGANQAVAAARLGADVTMVGAVGDDPFAEEALAGLRAAGVQLEVERRGQTGLAFIYVDADGENQIGLFAGANGELSPREVVGAVLCQLEVPDAVVIAAARQASFFALNAAPARSIDVEPDLLVLNEQEHETFSRGRLVAVTYGRSGAALFEDGREVARAVPPSVDVVDTTGAGDAFTAALVVSLLEGLDRQAALERACAEGARATTRMGAQWI